VVLPDAVPVDRLGQKPAKRDCRSSEKDGEHTTTNSNDEGFASPDDLFGVSVFQGEHLVTVMMKASVVVGKGCHSWISGGRWLGSHSDNMQVCSFEPIFFFEVTTSEERKNDVALLLCRTLVRHQNSTV
jgi:hypothetical protein